MRFKSYDQFNEATTDKSDSGIKHPKITHDNKAQIVQFLEESFNADITVSSTLNGVLIRVEFNEPELTSQDPPTLEMVIYNDYEGEEPELDFQYSQVGDFPREEPNRGPGDTFNNSYWYSHKDPIKPVLEGLASLVKWGLISRKNFTDSGWRLMTSKSLGIL